MLNETRVEFFNEENYIEYLKLEKEYSERNFFTQSIIPFFEKLDSKIDEVKDTICSSCSPKFNYSTEYFKSNGNITIATDMISGEANISSKNFKSVVDYSQRLESGRQTAGISAQYGILEGRMRYDSQLGNSVLIQVNTGNFSAGAMSEYDVNSYFAKFRNPNYGFNVYYSGEEGVSADGYLSTKWGTFHGGVDNDVYIIGYRKTFGLNDNWSTTVGLQTDLNKHTLDIQTTSHNGLINAINTKVIYSEGQTTINSKVLFNDIFYIQIDCGNNTILNIGLNFKF